MPRVDFARQICGGPREWRAGTVLTTSMIKHLPANISTTAAMQVSMATADAHSGNRRCIRRRQRDDASKCVTLVRT